MRVTINGSGHILTHGDSLSGAGVIEFPINEPAGFPHGYTVDGSAPARTLTFGGETVAVEENADDRRPEAIGFGVHWFNFAGWTIADGEAWRQDVFVPTGVDWDTHGFQNPDFSPYFTPLVPEAPVGLGGTYLSRARFSYSSDTAGGFVNAAAVDTATGVTWAPVVDADGTLQTLVTVDLVNLADGDNSLDVLSFINRSGHDVLVHRVDWWAFRLGPVPVTP